MKEIAGDLLSEAKTLAVKSPIAAEPGSPASPGGAQPRVSVSARLQKQKVADAMLMVEREYVCFILYVFGVIY